MKKIVAILMALTLTLALLAGCGSAAGSSSEASKLPNSLEEIMDTILQGFGEDELPALMPADMLDGHKYLPLDDENGELYVGTTGFVEGIAADAAINVIPFSVCLVRAESTEKAADLATIVKANADPNKWICAEAESKAVATVEDVVLLVMADKELCDKIVANFEALA